MGTIRKSRLRVGGNYFSFNHMEYNCMCHNTPNTWSEHLFVCLFFSSSSDNNLYHEVKIKGEIIFSVKPLQLCYVKNIPNCQFILTSKEPLLKLYLDKNAIRPAGVYIDCTDYIAQIPANNAHMSFNQYRVSEKLEHRHLRNLFHVTLHIAFCLTAYFT